MQFPGYTIERVNTHGIHLDPQNHPIIPSEAKETWSDCYEFRFFSAGLGRRSRD